MRHHRKNGLRQHWTRWALLFLVLGPFLQPALPIILMDTGDPTANTTAPTGEFAGSGWELQGFWALFLGTPIAPHYFLTARHLGGTIGDPFVFEGVTYTTTSFADDPDSDLRIWQVRETFPAYASLYSNNNELRQPLIVFGRGTQRGAAFTLNIGGTSRQQGWLWGPADGVIRWGANRVGSIEDGDQSSNNPTGHPIGSLLTGTFDRNGGANEATLSVGDSGGAVFIQDQGIWKLAGINFSVDGPYSLTNSGAGFQAALFDQRGLYVEQSLDQWTLLPNSGPVNPAAFYATRVSSHLAWINSIISQAPPTAPVLQSAPTVTGLYSDEPLAIVDPNQQTVSVPVPISTRFYRLSGSTALSIQTIARSGSLLVLHYQ